MPAPPPKLSTVASAAAAPKKSAAKKKAPAAPDDTASVDITQIRSLWPAVLEVVKSKRKVAWMVFSDSAPLSWESGTLAVAMRDASKIANAQSSGHTESLSGAIAEVLRIEPTIDLVLEPDAPSATAQHAEPDEPSIDDATVNDVSGVDLAIRELGATTIGEIEHS